MTLQSNLSAPQAKAAMEDLVAAYAKEGSDRASLNTVAAETFRTQLPTYLTSANPPDVYTWYPGSVADAYAKKNLLLDLDAAWTSSPDLKRYSKALNSLCTSTSSGKKVFVPTTYYWWGMFYRKSNFAKWGVSEPKSWDDFLDLCDKLKSKGVTPIGLGAGGGTAWVASAWFDYLDIRINGAEYHRQLLAGKHRFDDPEVRKVFDRWQEVLPYIDPNGTAVAFQDASTSLLNGRSGMMLIGTFFADAAPKNALDDVDFFRFPIIDPKVPLAARGAHRRLLRQRAHRPPRPGDRPDEVPRDRRGPGDLHQGLLRHRPALQPRREGRRHRPGEEGPQARRGGGRGHPVLQPGLQRRPPALRRQRADQVPGQAQVDRQHPHGLAARRREDLERLTWPS